MWQYNPLKMSHSLAPMSCRRVDDTNYLHYCRHHQTMCHNFIVRLWEWEEDGPSTASASRYARSPVSLACLHILASPTRSYKSTQTQHAACLNAGMNRYPNFHRISRFDIQNSRLMENLILTSLNVSHEPVYVVDWMLRSAGEEEEDPAWN